MIRFLLRRLFSGYHTEKQLAGQHLEPIQTGPHQGSTLSVVLPLDRLALSYYGVCFLIFATMAVAGFHGSSIGIHGSTYHYSSVKHHPLLGEPKSVRSDEWNYHTPAILNQVLRRDRLAADSSLFGPDKAALFANIPTRHWTEWFRPQFWVFHCLPPAAAYSFYWQTKGLLLLIGTFSLFLLITRNSVAAALGALWYFFSAYTQWSYSWPTLLPEMIGLFGLVICFTAYMTVGRNCSRLTVAAVLCALCAVDFALCAYPPHQIPLVICGLAIAGWWLWTRADLIFCNEKWLARSMAVGGCWFSVALVMGLFYLDTQVGFGELARTVYPGQRSVGGGTVTAAQMLSHFMDFWKQEKHYPAALNNICESTGYLWLAPATLLMPWPAVTARCTRLAYLFLWVAFVLLVAWMLLPIPAAVGQYLLLDKVPPNRCLHALGLINIAIVVTYVSAQWPTPVERTVRLKTDGPAFVAIFILLLIALVYMNSVYGRFFTRSEVAIAAAYTAFLVSCLSKRWRRLLATALLLPAAATTASVNPLDRGLDVILQSPLFRVLERQPELRNGRWLAFSPSVVLPGFVSACGVDLTNGLKIIPALNELALFDPDKRYRSIINQSCYLLAHVQTEVGPGQFESSGPGYVEWKVNPLDPRLREIGVKYVAFDSPPDSSIREKLKLIFEEESGSIWVYELP